MLRTFEAIYANGVLRPVGPVEFLDENARVTVVVTVADANGRPPLDGWVGGVSDTDAAAMRQAIDTEFERVDPDDWK